MSVIAKPARVAVLEELAERWNQASIAYATTNSLCDYPTEVGRDLDVLVAKRLASADEIAPGKEILRRIFGRLVGLIRSNSDRVYDGHVAYEPMSRERGESEDKD